MEELEAMKKKKQQLLERNQRFQENQEKPQRDYSNSITRSGQNSCNQSSSATSNLGRRSIGRIGGSNLATSSKKATPHMSIATDEIKELAEESKEQIAAQTSEVHRSERTTEDPVVIAEKIDE